MKAIVFTIALLVSTQAFSQSLKDKKLLNEWSQYLENESESSVKKFKDSCGYALKIEIDPKMAGPFAAKNAHGGSYCDEARKAMAELCADKTGKDSVTKNIKTLSCKLSDSDEIKMSLKGGVFEFKVGTGSGNLSTKAKTFLEENLD